MNMRGIVFILVFKILLVTSLGAQADTREATLVIPEELNILSVNDTKYSSKLLSNLLSNDDQTLKLEPGQHRIVVEYEIIFDISGDDHERIYSKPFQISFTTEPAKQYYIKVPSFIYIEDAKKYANKPVVELIDRTTNRVVAAQVIYQDDGRNLFQRFNDLAATTTRPTQTRATGAYVPVPVTNTGTSQGGSLPPQMLKYWWNQANEQQRKHFIGSVK